MKGNVVLPPEVKRVYSLVNKTTGAIGGNGEPSVARRDTRVPSTVLPRIDGKSG